MQPLGQADNTRRAGQGQVLPQRGCPRLTAKRQQAWQRGRTGGKRARGRWLAVARPAGAAGYTCTGRRGQNRYRRQQGPGAAAAAQWQAQECASRWLWLQRREVQVGQCGRRTRLWSGQTGEYKARPTTAHRKQVNRTSAKQALPAGPQATWRRARARARTAVDKAMRRCDESVSRRRAAQGAAHADVSKKRPSGEAMNLADDETHKHAYHIARMGWWKSSWPRWQVKNGQHWQRLA